MPRVSKAQATQHRALTIEAAAHLFRERGFDHVTVQDIMASVGLTQGGFYSQFDSKESLLSEAARYAYASVSVNMHQTEANAMTHHEAQLAYIREYLSVNHRDQPGQGCPTAGLVQDIARIGNVKTRNIMASGIADLAAWLDQPHQAGLVTFCTMVGALVIARAAKGTPLSDEILEQVNASFGTFS